jgi:hypothetical protein
MALQSMHLEPTFQILLCSSMKTVTAQSFRIVTEIQEDPRTCPVFSEAVVHKDAKDTGNVVAPNLAEVVKLAEVDLQAGRSQAQIQDH